MAERDGQDVVLVDRGSGQVRKLLELKAELADASPPDLSAIIVQTEEVRAALGELDAAARAELLRHLDRSGVWTKRYGDVEDGVQYEVKAPSPTAGVDGYDESELEGQLRALIAEDVINHEGAGKALKRTVTLELGVGLDDDLEALARKLEGGKIRIAGVEVTTLKVTAQRSVILSGVNALLKVPGTAEALRKAYRARTPSGRRPTVKAIRKGE